MEATAFRDAGVADRQAIWRIYEEALPASERKSRDAIRAIGDNAEYRFTLFSKCGSIEGFSITFVPAGERFAVLEYLAVDPTRRSQGAGTAILQTVFDDIGDRTLLIEVDRDGSEQAARRRRFYERAGCAVLDGVQYRMPQIGAEPPPEMELMARLPDPHFTLSRHDLARWIEIIDTRMYAQTSDCARIAAMLDGAPDRWKGADH